MRLQKHGTSMKEAFYLLTPSAAQFESDWKTDPHRAHGLRPLRLGTRDG